MFKAQQMLRTVKIYHLLCEASHSRRSLLLLYITQKMICSKPKDMLGALFVMNNTHDLSARKVMPWMGSLSPLPIFAIFAHTGHVYEA